jgi:hypothetical protein
VHLTFFFIASCTELHWTADTQLTTDKWTGQLNCLWDNSLAWATSTTPFFYWCVCVHFHGNVFTKPLLRNGLHNPTVLLLHACMLYVLPSNSHCLQSHCLAVGQYALILETKQKAKFFNYMTIDGPQNYIHTYIYICIYKHTYTQHSIYP